VIDQKVLSIKISLSVTLPGQASAVLNGDLIGQCERDGCRDDVYPPGARALSDAPYDTVADMKQEPVADCEQDTVADTQPHSDSTAQPVSIPDLQPHAKPHAQPITIADCHAHADGNAQSVAIPTHQPNKLAESFSDEFSERNGKPIAFSDRK
jgi:hypothetical protein